MPADAAQTFFISRAGADKAIAAEIGHILEDAGHSVILQQWDFANRNFMEAMQAALESGARVIALLSPEYFKSEHCMSEALNAIGHDPLNKRGRLISMRVAECTPGGLFTALAYWDLLPLAGNAAMLRETVLAAVDKNRRKTAADAAAAYWRSPRTVLHDRIRAVPNFTGRREDLDALGSALWGGGQAVAITQAAVQGLGGAGKSALAIQYAWENGERYAGAWWLGADSPAGIVDGLVALGVTFNPALAEVQDRAEAARWTLAFLANGGFEKPWLLLYDNVTQPKALDGLLPRAGAHVLVTTRWPDWQGRAAAVPLGVFAPREAVDFLLARTGRTDAQGAAALARDLGHLPLALDHAAAYCRRTGTAFEAYRALLPDLIKRAPKDADYPADVYATFSLAIESAAKNCPAAEALMGILAWFAPDDIPLDVIGAEAMSGIERGDAVAALHEVSLLDVKSAGSGEPTVSVHRLVQMVMRARLAAPGEAEAAAAVALTLVADAFPNPASDLRNWPACAALRPHAFSILETAPDTGEISKKTSRLLNQLAIYLNSRAEFAEAEPLMRRALAVDEESFGPGHPNVAIRLNNLAQLLQNTNRLAEAEPLMRRALAIDEESFGPGHPDVARDLNNLAALLQATNRLAEAEPLMRRALAIDEQSFGPGHPNVATALNNLALLLQGTNRLAEAEPLMRRALAIDEESFGPGHPNVAIRLNNLAQLLKATNRLAEAEPLMRRALAIFDESFGPAHPAVASTLNNLAQLLHATNRLAEAEPLMRRALAIDEESFGPAHPNVARDLNNLAQLLQATNRLAEAEPLMRRALAIDEESFGPGHPDVARDLNNLAQLLKATHRLAEAEPLMRRALAIDEKSFGPGHPDVARDLNNLAQLLKATNRLAEAEPLMWRALAIDEESFGPGHPDVARDLNNLAQLLKATHRLAEAEPLMRRALAIDEKSFGPGHPEVARDLNNLAQLLKATNRLAEAEPLMRRAVEIWNANLGPDHPNTQTVVRNYLGIVAALKGVDVETLVKDLQGRSEAAEGALTRPQSGHPLPQGERATPRRGLFARMLGWR